MTKLGSGQTAQQQRLPGKHLFEWHFAGGPIEAGTCVLAEKIYTDVKKKRLIYNISTPHATYHVNGRSVLITDTIASRTI